MSFNIKLGSNCQQFHQYQQSRQSPLTSTIEHEKKTTTYDVGNPGPGLEQAQKCGRIKPINGISTLPTCSIYILIISY